MQIAAEVRRVLAKKPDAVKLDDFKLKFQLIEKKPASKLTKIQTAKRSMARWLATVGLKREPHK